MTAEIWIFLTIVVISLVLLKKSNDEGMLPHAIPLITGLFGFLFYGIFGIIAGYIIGVIFNFVSAGISKILVDVFNKGIIKEDRRKLIAKQFILKHRDEIEALKKQHKENLDLVGEIIPPFKIAKNKKESQSEVDKIYSDEKLVDAFSRYINEIYREISKLKNPIRKHRHDLETFLYKENFIEGGENWVKKPFFKSKPPLPAHTSGWTNLKEKFVEFCVNVIYENPERVSVKPICENPEQIILSLKQNYFDLKNKNPNKDEHWLLANTWLKRYGHTDTAKQKGNKLTKFIAYRDTWQFSILESPKSIRAFTLWLIYKELDEQTAENYVNEFSQLMELVEKNREKHTLTEKYKQINPQTWKEIETEKDESRHGLYGFFKAGEDLDKHPD